MLMGCRMDSVSLSLTLTPHGRLVLVHDAGAARLDAGLAERLRLAFERGSGHGLLLLGADVAGSALPPDCSYWREFGARYVTALCTHEESDAPRGQVRVAAPPSEELERMAQAAPPMLGAEYLTVAVLQALWRELEAAFESELSESKCGVQDFLKRRNPAWNLVGRVHFNVAENRKDSGAPFAFMATYTTRLSGQSKAQHLPLGQALSEYAGAANTDRLLSLLLPVQRASEACPWLKAIRYAGRPRRPCGFCGTSRTWRRRE
jgi:non-specific serine/threonine protein kinase